MEQPHLLLVSYVFRPADLSPVRRVAAFERYFGELGIRTSVLTTTVYGELPDDSARGVLRAPDLRARMGSASGDPQPTGRPKRWPRLIAPDATAVSWVPAALRAARRLVREDRPQGVLTTSPPESAHLIGLALSRWGIPWIADLRDGWTYEPTERRPYLTSLDRALERKVVTSADAVTAVTAPIANDLDRRYGLDGRVRVLSNGFDPDALERATDERPTLDPKRFSLVYTGTGGIDGKDPRPFLRSLTRLLRERPNLSEQLQVTIAGLFTEEEIAAITDPALHGVVEYLGKVEHSRALGLQRAADGLVLITSIGLRQVATMKIYEYLAAEKPILGLADRNTAAELLESAGPHTLAAPDDENAILAGLRTYLDAWLSGSQTYRHHASFDLDAFAFPRLTERLAGIFGEIGALPERR